MNRLNTLRVAMAECYPMLNWNGKSTERLSRKSYLLSSDVSRRGARTILPKGNLVTQTPRAMV